MLFRSNVRRTGGDAHRSRPAYRGLDYRTVAQIQRSVVKLGKSNPISRRLHAKNDKDTIAAWKSDLNRILQVFNVRSTVPCLPIFLTSRFQTELALQTHEVVSDIHRTVVKGREGIDIRNQTVSAHCNPFVALKPLRFPIA